MKYTLDEKITITKEFLDTLETQSWREIENLQAQIANIEVTNQNSAVIQLLKNLLTSYYVFVGGLENLNSETTSQAIDFSEIDATVEQEPEQINNIETTQPAGIEDYPTEQDFEPFEYFVDFDEPIGEPLSDEDLYGK